VKQHVIVAVRTNMQFHAPQPRETSRKIK